MRCPGQDQRFWKLDDIFDVECPHCGTAVEFWKDEPGVKCPGCRTIIANPRLDLGCAEWCQHSEQCLGTLVDPESILSKKLIREMKTLLGEDTARIDHALAVFRSAQEIVGSEQGDARVVYAAAILHGVAGSCAGDVDSGTDGSGRSTVQEILSRCGLDSELVARICTLIDGHCRHDIGDSAESKVLWDAEWLARIGDSSFVIPTADAEKWVAHTFRTRKGRDLAAARLRTLEDGKAETLP